MTSHADVGHGGGRQEGVEAGPRLERQVIALDPDAAARAGERGDGAPVVVSGPVGVGQRLAMAAPPGLAAVYVGGDHGRRVGGDHAGVGTAERAVEKARVVGHGLHRGQHGGVQTLGGEGLAQAVEAGLVLLRREGQGRLGAVVEAKEGGAVGHGTGS